MGKFVMITRDDEAKALSSVVETAQELAVNVDGIVRGVQLVDDGTYGIGNVAMYDITIRVYAEK